MFTLFLKYGPFQYIFHIHSCTIVDLHTFLWLPVIVHLQIPIQIQITLFYIFINMHTSLSLPPSICKHIPSFVLIIVSDMTFIVIWIIIIWTIVPPTFHMLACTNVDLYKYVWLLLIIHVLLSLLHSYVNMHHCRLQCILMIVDIRHSYIFIPVTLHM